MKSTPCIGVTYEFLLFPFGSETERTEFIFDFLRIRLCFIVEGGSKFVDRLHAHCDKVEVNERLELKKIVFVSLP